MIVYLRGFQGIVSGSWN